MRRTLVCAGAAVAIAGGVAGSQALAASSVKVGDNWFVRSSGVPTISAKAGSKVTFKWVGSSSHDVRVKSGPSKFASPIKSSGTYKTPKLKAGTYVIFCSIHGQSDQSMKLKVKK